jgi:hypothetical protein
VQKELKKVFNMRRYLLGNLLLGILFIQCGCSSNKSFFQNKILIYNSVPDSGPTTMNATFIDFYKDTINKIDYPFSLFEKQQGLINVQDTANQKYRLPNIFPYSGVPFKFERRNKSIFITYTFKDEIFEKKYFQLSKRDSVKTSSFDYLCNTNSDNNWVITRFVGEATIKISSRKVRCWIFEEKYPYLFSPNQRARIIYLAKESLLPVQINTIYYRPDRKNPSNIITEHFKSKIDTVFNRPWNSTDKKWNYPKCWKK